MCPVGEYIHGDATSEEREVAYMVVSDDELDDDAVLKLLWDGYGRHFEYDVMVQHRVSKCTCDRSRQGAPQ